MVIDRIENSARYDVLGNGIALALRALREGHLVRREAGRYDLMGDAVYALVQAYETKPREQGVWEAHRKYIDVQFVAEGTEVMAYANLADLKPRQPYDDANDYALFDGLGSFVTVSSGMFTIFYPEDAHMPGLAAASPEPVEKVVVKVRVS